VSVCLVIRHTTRMRRYCRLWLVWLYHIFPHYLIKGTIFGKTLLNLKCVFWFSLQLLSETFLILRRIQRDMIIKAHRSSCKVPIVLSDFNETWMFSTDCRKILKIPNFINIDPVGAELFHVYGRTDVTKLIVVFRSFANAPKNRFTGSTVIKTVNLAILLFFFFFFFFLPKPTFAHAVYTEIQFLSSSYMFRGPLAIIRKYTPQYI
jgi:hypothetical protein